MYSVRETARKITCPTGSDEMNLKHCEILERRSKCKVPDRNRHTSKVRERVHRQRLGRPSNKVQKHNRRSCAVEKTQHSQHGHEHSKQRA